jgi:exopolyphosphatase
VCSAFYLERTTISSTTFRHLATSSFTVAAVTISKRRRNHLHALKPRQQQQKKHQHTRKMSTCQDANTKMVLSMSDFLSQQQRGHFHHIVIGNPAGDADSIVSSLALAYVESLMGRNLDMTPIVSVPRDDLSLRCDVTLLLEMMNIPQSVLTFLDDIPLNLTGESMVTLVDHNQLQYPRLENCHVVEILDHHRDDGKHTHVMGASRNIAFQESSALVGSTCTLVGERYLQSQPIHIPCQLSWGLLGVILLDTVNMCPKAGKGTVRDQAVLSALLDKTDWSGMEHHESTMKFFKSHRPDTKALFEYLSQSKFDRGFWSGLSAYDALRLDFKQFTTSNGDAFGVSSVLLPLCEFAEKSNVVLDISRFMSECQIQVLIILSMVIEGTQPKRSLQVCGLTDSEILNKITGLLIGDNALQLSEVKSDIKPLEICIRQFDQGNPKASRKQVVPIILDFYESLNS